MICAAILAGGSGSRMAGSGRPKQFLNIEGKPVLVRTVEAFYACTEVDYIVVAVAREWLDHTEGLLATAFGETERILVTVGGADRLNSLTNVCAFIAGHCGVREDDVIVTHDAARPFVTPALIRATIAGLSRFEGVTAAIPVVDTILVSGDGEEVDAIPDRQTMFAVQTPQTFRTAELIAAISSLAGTERVSLTDAAKIYLLKGKSVGIVRGDVSNFKLTMAADLDQAALLVRATEAKKGET